MAPMARGDESIVRFLPGGRPVNTLFGRFSRVPEIGAGLFEAAIPSVWVVAAVG